MVVSKQSYDPTNVNIGPAVAALRSSGAQVVVSFSIPAFTALLKLNSLKLGFNPTLVVSNVGSDPITLSGLLEAYAKQGGAKVNGNQLINGIISDGYLPTLGAPGNSWIALFKKVHDQYDPKAPLDGNVLYGEAVGYTFVQAMFKAGRNPTRANLVSAIQKGLPQGPSVAPYSYSSSDHHGYHRRLHGCYPEWPAGAAGVGPDHGRFRIRCHLHIFGIRAAGASEWHTVTLTWHRPSPTERAGISRYDNGC